jgi:hypothetical protein
MLLLSANFNFDNIIDFLVLHNASGGVENVDFRSPLQIRASEFSAIRTYIDHYHFVAIHAYTIIVHHFYFHSYFGF